MCRSIFGKVQMFHLHACQSTWLRPKDILKFYKRVKKQMKKLSMLIKVMKEANSGVYFSKISRNQVTITFMEKLENGIP